MNKKSRSSKRLIISTVGVALAIPLVAVPASASLGNSGFFVHAQNIQSPEFKATAGLKGTDQSGSGGGSSDPGDGSAPGSGGDGTGSGGTGGGTPGTGGGDTGSGGGAGGTGSGDTGSDQNDSTVLASYKCGPMAVDVTKAMVNFSKTNEDLAAQGEALKTNSDGWSTISSYDTAKGSMALGFPDDGSLPPALSLSSGSDIAQPSQVTDDTKLMIFDLRPLGVDQCTITDLRGAPRAGATTSYTFTGSDTPGRDYYSETRYLQEDGVLRLVNSGKQADGGQSVDRYVSPTDFSTPLQSDTKPYSLRLGKDGQITYNQHLKTPVDGYDRFYFSELPDGSGSEMYLDQGTGNLADRKHGPSRIVWDTEGQIVFVNSTDGNNYSSVADYNAGTGQNWDGSYLHASDLDLTVPFAPTAP